jgi:hypothetical protein
MDAPEKSMGAITVCINVWIDSGHEDQKKVTTRGDDKLFEIPL